MARRELYRAFPSTFGRLVQVKRIEDVPVSESERRNLPSSSQAVHIHVVPDQYSLPAIRRRSGSMPPSRRWLPMTGAYS